MRTGHLGASLVQLRVISLHSARHIGSHSGRNMYSKREEPVLHLKGGSHRPPFGDYLLSTFSHLKNGRTGVTRISGFHPRSCRSSVLNYIVRIIAVTFGETNLDFGLPTEDFSNLRKLGDFG